MQKAEGRRQKRGLAGPAIGRVWLLVFLLWGCAFSLAGRLLSRPELQKNAGDGLIAELFGETRFAIGGLFYEQADRVFHKGVGHYQPAAFQDWFARRRAEVAPAGHAHLHAAGVLEIMPWLYFATRADPGNITAYIVAAFWLAQDGGRPDLAEQVLNEGLRRNPSDYRLYLEKGNLALRQGRYAKAARWLDAARAFYPAAAGEDQEQMRIDRAEILTYRGLLYEINRSPENALRCFREVVEMFPGRLQLKERIVELEKNGRAATPAEQMISGLMLQHRHVCAEAENE